MPNMTTYFPSILDSSPKHNLTFHSNKFIFNVDVLQAIRWIISHWMPYVTGEIKQNTLSPGLGSNRGTHLTNILPRRYKSQRVPQGSTSVYYT